MSIVILTIVTSQLCSEDRYEFIAKVDAGQYLFDKLSIKCEQSKTGEFEIEAWIKFEHIATSTATMTANIFETMNKEEKESESKTKIVYTLSLVNLKYPNREIALKQVISYNAAGDNVSTQSFSEPFSKVIPGTIGEGVYFAVIEFCKREKIINEKKGWFW